MPLIIPWWQQRLREGFPISGALCIEGYNFTKAREGEWPSKVARKALILDYWAYQQSNDLKAGLPVVFVPEAIFWSTMSPFLYPQGKQGKVVNRYVNEQRPFQGGFVTMRVRRYFIRLCALEEHIATFCHQTGLSVKP